MDISELQIKHKIWLFNVNGSFTDLKIACWENDLEKLKSSKRHYNKDIVNLLLVREIRYRKNSNELIEYLANKKNADLDFCIEYFKIWHSKYTDENNKEECLMAIDKLTTIKEKNLLTKIAKPKKLSKPKPNKV